MSAYWSDETVSLYLGDCRDVVPALGPVDCVVTDPPYGETKYPWDRWPAGWLDTVGEVTGSLWCFGSLRLFGARWGEFTGAGWKLSQDVVWQKHNASGPDADRFRRVHELAVHWYQGRWRDVYHQPQRVRTGAVERGRIIGKGAKMVGHRGDYGVRYWSDDGTRLMASVLAVRSMHRRGAIHPTHKPAGILEPLLAYACPPGGVVLDPFAGSGSTLVAARAAGRRAIGVEGDERYCEAAARWLDQTVMQTGA